MHSPTPHIYQICIDIVARRLPARVHYRPLLSKLRRSKMLSRQSTYTPGYHVAYEATEMVAFPCQLSPAGFYELKEGHYYIYLYIFICVIYNLASRDTGMRFMR